MSAIQDSVPVPGTVNGDTAADAIAAAKPAVRLTDSTLRDGSHAVAHQFTLDHVVAITGALDAAGVQVVEVTHGDGLSGSTFNYGFGRHTDAELVATAVQTVDCARCMVSGRPLPGSRPTPPRPTSRSSISGRRASWAWKPLAS